MLWHRGTMRRASKQRHLKCSGVSRDVEDPETGPTFHRRVGTKLYALADHLGSVDMVMQNHSRGVLRNVS